MGVLTDMWVEEVIKTLSGVYINVTVVVVSDNRVEMLTDVNVNVSELAMAAL